MKSIQDLTLFDQDDQFLAKKTKSIDALMEDQDIQGLFDKYDLTRQDIEDNWIDFLDYQEDCQMCRHCTGLSQCQKVSVGMKRVFHKEGDEISLSLTPCRFGSENLENQKILSKIILKNVSDQLLLSNVQSISEVAKDSHVIKAIDQYLNQPTKKGFYIYGRPGCGKSTLAGFIIRHLAKSGASCGYVHFPTFLMDLKNSFGEGGKDSRVDLMKSLDYLVLDDIGGENVTNWSRDEILSSVLSYRNQNHKVTFFTSEYPLDQLKSLYMLKQGDKLRVERLIDRMKAVSIVLPLKGNDLR